MTRLDELRAKLAASERLGPGYKDRIEAIRKEIEWEENNVTGDKKP